MTNAASPACPRCGSADSVARGRLFFAILGLCIIGFSIVIMFLIPPLGIGGIVLGIAFLGFSPFARDFRQCRQCRRLWKVRQFIQ